MKKRNRIISTVIIISIICQMLLVQSVMGKDVTINATYYSNDWSTSGNERNILDTFSKSLDGGYLSVDGGVPWEVKKLSSSGSRNSMGTEYGYTPVRSKSSGKTTSSYFMIDLSNIAAEIDSNQIKYKAMVDMGNNSAAIGKNKDEMKLIITCLDEDKNAIGNSEYKKHTVYYKDWKHNVTIENKTLPEGTRYVKYEVWTKDISGFLWASGIFSMFANPRFYLYDTKGPEINQVTIDTNNRPSYTVGAETTVLVGEGNGLAFTVEFNEPVRFSDFFNLKYRFYDGTKSINGVADYGTAVNDATHVFYGAVPAGVTNNMVLEVLDVYYSKGDVKTLVKDNRNNSLYSTNAPLMGPTVKVDGVAPILKQLVCDSGNGNYSHREGENYIDFKLTFNEAVNSSSKVYLLLSNGGQANYLRGNGTKTLTYRYTVNETDMNTARLMVEGIETTGKEYDNIADLVGNRLNTEDALPAQYQNVTVDTQAPTVAITNEDGTLYVVNEDYKKTHRIFISSTDKDDVTELVDIDIKYAWGTSQSIDDNFVWEQATNGTAAINPPSTIVDDKYYLHVRAMDNALNNNSVVEGPFYFDNEGPVITISPESGINQPQYNVNIHVEDDQSGIKQIKYNWRNQSDDQLISTKTTPLNEVTYSTEIMATSPDMNGSFYIEVEAIDNVDNIGMVNSLVYQVDKDYPTVIFTPEGNEKGSKNCTVEVEINDSSSIEACYYQWTTSVIKPDLSDTNWIAFFTADSNNPVNTHTETIPSGDGKNGTWYLHLKCEDGSGNVGTYITSKGFKLDNENPELVFSPNGNTNPNQVFTTYLKLDNEKFGYTVNYNISTSSTTTYDDGEFITYEGDGDEIIFTIDSQAGDKETDTYYIHTKVVDDAGNTSVLSSEKIYIDNTAPTGSISFNNSHTKESTEQLTLIASDIYPMGASEDISTRISLDGGTNWGDWMAFSQTKDITFTEEKAYDIVVQYKDSAGNESELIHREITYDSTVPEIDEIVYDNNWTNQPLPVTITFVDATPSEDMVIEVIHNETTADVVVQDNVIVFKENGICSFKYKDLAGNENSDVITIANMDIVGPEIAFLPNGNEETQRLAQTNITVTDNVSATQDIEIYYSWTQNQGIQPTDWTLAHENVISKIGGTGNWYLFIKAIDETGNITVATSQAFVLDNSRPNVSGITYSPAVITANDVIAKIEFDEKVRITAPEVIDTLATSYEYTFDSNGSVEIVFEDEVGNENSQIIEVDWIDRNKPSASNVYEPNTWTNQGVIVTVTVDDDQFALYDVKPMINGERVLIKAANDSNEIAECVYNWNNDTGSVQLSGHVNDDFSEGQVTLTEVSVNGDGYVTEAKFLLVENGTIDYKIKRLDTGVSGFGQAVVDKIDKVSPTVGFTYTSKNSTWYHANNGIWTNEDVILSIAPSDNSGQPVKIVNNNGSNHYVFTENEVIEFILEDVAGNITTTTAGAIKIDKELPIGTLTYTTENKQWVDDELWTNKDVIVTLDAVDNSGQPVEILNNEGSHTYVFSENGSYTFKIRDAAGNENEIKATVSKIDKEAPNPIISYSTQRWTKEDVTVSIAFNNEDEEVTILNNEGSNSYTFKENGVFTFEFEDIAGNQEQVEVVVNNIDKQKPQVSEVWYSTTEPTNGMVTARIYTDEKVTFLTDYGANSYTFEENGSHEFVFEDRAGNRNSQVVEVTNIDRTPPTTWIEYSTTEATNEDVVATLKADEPILIINNINRNQYVFKENGTFEFIYTDLAGNRSEITASVNNIDTVLPQITLEYSETALTQQDVLVTISSDKPITPINYEGDTFTFTENGVKWLKAEDSFGEEFYFSIEVNNIDRTAPTIEFLEEKILIVALNNDFDPLEDVRITDNLDEEISENVEVVHNVNTRVEGQYEIKYIATDAAGNSMAFTRKVIVINPDKFTAFVNGVQVKASEMVTEDTGISLDIFGVQGNYSAKWLRGKKGEGAFKGCETYCDNDYLAVNKSGYITLLIRDQELNKILIHVYVIYTEQ